jgi:hypothetical protein
MSEPVLARVVHAVPGRIRLRWPALGADLERIEALAAELRAVEGVQSVALSPRTGSIVVAYDPETLAEADLRARARAALGVERFLEKDEPSKSSRTGGPRKMVEGSKLALALAAFFDDLNGDVIEATGGHADLASLMPAAFVGLGLVEVAVTRELPAPPWWSLFWWSFRAFLSLNQPAIAHAKNGGRWPF